MRIAVVGVGYVGLVVGVCLADSGHELVGVDNDHAKIDLLNKGQVPIYEPGLKEFMERNIREGRLSFSTELKKIVQESFLVFIAVGTPLADRGRVDMSAVQQVIQEIGEAINEYKVIIIKSTVPVGTACQVQAVLAELTEHDFSVVSNPEFLKEGNAVQDFMKPDRIILGTDDRQAAEILKEIYAPFVRTGNPILVMDPESAEMVKYAANAMLATRISFMNEIAGLCEKLGANVENVRRAIGADKRIGSSFLFPGVGYGGSCLPKDVKALISLAEDQGAALDILTSVDRVNERQKRVLFNKICEHFDNCLAGRKIAVWGLSFKPGTDDLRESPAIALIDKLIEKGAHIQAHDPVANKGASQILPAGVNYFGDCYQAVEGAEALALVTEWSEFKYPDFERIKDRMKSPVIFDGRNIYNPGKLRGMGFTYYGIGRV
ncbi:MAG: UDP-glucose/GDP-mannose dehydrogenase family protein [Thermodesulfobacteriota bacterium]